MYVTALTVGFVLTFRNHPSSTGQRKEAMNHLVYSNAQLAQMNLIKMTKVTREGMTMDT